jgi:hypothetical protein
MPWTAKDAHKHKKGLTPRQAKQWAAVANSALEACESEGGSDCDASAIRQANASVGRPKAKQLVEQFSEQFYGDGEESVEMTDGEEEQKCMSDYAQPSMLTYGAESYADVERSEELARITMEIDEKVRLFPSIVNNIMYDDEISDKAAAVEKLGGELAKKIREISGGDASKEKWAAAYMNDLPDSAFLFIESGGSKDSEGKTAPRSLRHLPYKDKEGKISVEHVRNAIQRAPQIKLKDGSKISSEKATQLQDRARRILKSAGKKEVDDETLVEKVKAIVLSLFGKHVTKETKVDNPKNGFSVWKSKKNEWMWAARYSNNIRDSDNPPEIISSDSHKRFVERVDKGVDPLPELWLWHIPELRIGQADLVAYDDSVEGVGFAIAAGHFLKGCEPVAEFLFGISEQLLVSHGMPVDSIVRDQNDSSIIVEHRTKEISPLPAWAAANMITGFITVKKEADDMAVSDEKKRILTEELGMPGDLISLIEGVNSEDATKAKAEGLETKDVTTDTTENAAEVEQTTEQAVVEQAVEQEQAAEQEQAPADVALEEPPTRKEVADAVAKVINEAVASLADQIKALTLDVENIKKNFESVRDEQKEEVRQVIKDTPSASLFHMLSRSVIGDKKTQVGDDDPLKGQKPKETTAPEDDKPTIGVQTVPFIRDMLRSEKAAARQQ